MHIWGSGTGTETLAGVPFRPRAIYVIATTNESTSTLQVAPGYAVDGSPIIQGSAGGIATTSGGTQMSSGSSTTQAFVRNGTNASVDFAATVTSFNEDGITVNKTIGSSNGSHRQFHILFFG